MGTFLLLRHGESVGNAARCFTSSPDAALTELGRRHAHEAGLAIRARCRPRLVIASPYRRARETAQIVADLSGVAIEIEPAFREQSRGEFAGKPYEVVRNYPDFDRARSWLFRPPNGESHDDVRRRSAPVLDVLGRKYPDDELVIVRHGGVMRALWAHAMGRWEDAPIPANCALVLIEHERGRYGAPRSIGNADAAWRELGA